MYIKFKKLRFKNFLAFGNLWTEFDLDKEHFTLIMGKNGSGKSTILDAICFVLFNKAFRNINKPQLVNSINQKDCVVECEFEINKNQFKIIRGLKPVIFEIYLNGKMLNQSAAFRDDQKAFESQILKINFKTFCQICVLGSAVYTPFMALAKGERRKIIEDLLDLEIFTKMNVLLKDKMDESNFIIKQLEHSKITNEEKLKLIIEHNNRLKETSEKILDEKEEKIKEYEGLIDKLERYIINYKFEIDILELKLKNYDNVNSKLDELKNFQHQLSIKSKNFSKEIHFLEKNTECPTCKQFIDEKFKSTTLDEKHSKLDEILTGLNKLEIEIKKYIIRLDEMNNIRKEIDEHRYNIRLTEGRIETNSKYIKELRKEIEDIKNSKFKNENKNLKEVQLNLIDTENNLKNKTENRTIMGFALNMLKDSGIKSKIIKIYIPIINSLLAKYTASLDFFVDFQINEFFEEKILSRHRDEFSFESFSEGQKMRINLAMLFTWRAVAKMKNSIDTNLLIFDEILESSLDVDGIDDFIKLLYSLTNNENIIIISPKGELYYDRFSKIITVEMNKNFSKIS